MSKETEKVAFVFDTNFIVQHKQELKDILERLGDSYVVYVPQLCIEERIAQRCREQKVKYDNFASLQKEYKHIATMKLSVPFEESIEKLRKRILASYKRLVGNRIIPLLKDEETFSSVLERALMKKPPFLSDDVSGKSSGKSPSDKGFKDAVLWVTLLQYFKENGEAKVLFLSDDKGFGDQAEKLCAEFKTFTGKDIEIRKNAYVEELIKEPEKSKEKPKEKSPQTTPPPLPDIRQMREKIQSVTTNVCGYVSEGYWGEEAWNSYFTLNRPFTAEDVAGVFSGMEALLRRKLFDSNISPVDIFEIEPFVVTTHFYLPTTAVEELSKLHLEIKQNYPEYITQFYGAVSNILNGNYVEPIPTFESDPELPF